MITPINPVNLRTTCIYDPLASQVFVNAPSGQRATYSYDASKNRPALLDVSNQAVTWMLDTKTGARRGLRPPVNGTVNALMPDAAGRMRLATVNGARTTYVFDVTNDNGEQHHTPPQTTLVCEPAGSESIVVIFLPASTEIQKFKAEFDAFYREADGDKARSLLDSILNDPVMRNLCAVVGHVGLRNSPGRVDEREELVQGTMYLVFVRLASRRFAYRDEGALRFGGWIRNLVFWHARRAWKRYCRKRIAPKMLRIDMLIDDLAAKSESEDLCRELWPLIARIRCLTRRGVMEDVFDGLTVRQSAQKRSLSKSEVQRHREAGRAFLRPFFESDG